MVKMFPNASFSRILVGCFCLILCYTAASSTHHSPETRQGGAELFQNERAHMEQHMDGIVDSTSLNHMSGEEVKFLYFTMHDNDQNNKLDGCELVKSLFHWHAEEYKAMGVEESVAATTRTFSNEDLSVVIDPILHTDDKNFDGFIDYPEFITASKSRGL